MQIAPVSLAFYHSSQGWSERRERRSGYRRRDEDGALGSEKHPPVVASLGFLTQVAAQSLPAPAASTGFYQAPRWRCGVCADERA